MPETRRFDNAELAHDLMLGLMMVPKGVRLAFYQGQDRNREAAASQIARALAARLNRVEMIVPVADVTPVLTAERERDQAKAAR